MVIEITKCSVPEAYWYRTWVNRFMDVQECADPDEWEVAPGNQHSGKRILKADSEDREEFMREVAV